VSSSEVVKLQIPSFAEFVGVARKAVEGIAAGMALTTEQVDDLKLAVGEACANAVKFSGPERPPVQVVYRIEPDRLEIEVRNTGEAFSSDDVQRDRPPLDDLHDRGLGLYLIDQVMDELDISSECGETTLKMVKRFAR